MLVFLILCTLGSLSAYLYFYAHPIPPAAVPLFGALTALLVMADVVAYLDTRNKTKLF